MVTHRLRGFFAPLLVGLVCTAAAAQGTTRISVSSAGLEGDVASQLFFSRSALSADGRYVGFSSSASNLMQGLPLNTWQSFVHDRQSGALELVSRSASGAPGNGHSVSTSLSASGRIAAFHSEADNLVGGTNPGFDVFVRDLDLQTIELASCASDGTPGNGLSWYAWISSDGRFVGFQSEADNLTPGDVNGCSDVFLRDRSNRTTILISRTPSGQNGNGISYSGGVSREGRWVSFTSEASDLVSGDTNGLADVFVHDRLTGTTVLGSVSSSGLHGDGISQAPALSDDGRFLVFMSNATNLVPADTNGVYDVFVRDLAAGTTVLVSRSSSGALGNSTTYMPAISRDGGWVAFTSEADNLVPEDTDAVRDAFVHELASGQTLLASKSSSGGKGDDGGESVSIAESGVAVAFDSWADNLVPGDTNATVDVFVQDWSPQILLAYGTAKSNSVGCAPAIGASGAPSLTGHDAFFVTATRVLNDEFGLLFWGRTPASIPFAGGNLWLQPFVRTPLRSSGGSSGAPDCSGAYSFHFSQSYMASQALIPGDTLYAQYWGHDPGFAPPNDVGLTDAIQFTVAP